MRKIALSAGSVILCLYAAELALRLFGPPVSLRERVVTRMEDRARLAAGLGIPYDRRLPLDVILDMRKGGTNVYPSGSFEAYLLNRRGLVEVVGSPGPDEDVRSRFVSNGRELLPLGNRSRTTMIGLDNENGYYPVFTTDERGFRNPAGIWSLTEVDIIGLGDSYVEGCEVNDADAFMSHIRARFPRTINLGLGGGSPLTMLAALREYGAVLKPRIVLWCFAEENDFGDLTVHMRNPTLASYLHDPAFRQNLPARQDEIDAALLRFLEDEIARVSRYRQGRSGKWRDRAGVFARSTGSFLALDRLRRQSRHAFAKARPPETVEEGEVRAAFDDILRNARQLARTWGGTVYFVHVPDARTLTPSGGRSRRITYIRAYTKQKAATLGIPYIDLPMALKERTDAPTLVPLGYGGHFSPRGNRVVADLIIERLLTDQAAPLRAPRRESSETRRGVTIEH